MAAELDYVPLPAALITAGAGDLEGGDPGRQRALSDRQVDCAQLRGAAQRRALTDMRRRPPAIEQPPVFG